MINLAFLGQINIFLPVRIPISFLKLLSMTKCGKENIKAKLFNLDLISNWVFGSSSVAPGKLWGDPGGCVEDPASGSFLLCFFHNESTVSERSLNFRLVFWNRLSSSTLLVLCRLHCDMTESNWELENLVRTEFFAFFVDCSA